MSETSWERAKGLFHQALERPEHERSAFLDGACAQDRELREEVDSLLAAHAADVEALSSPTLHPEELSDPTGARIGPYKLLQKIGEGGFGVVYMAEQREPVRRRVALKLIKLGMDTKQVIARFEAERQALALMEHTNIARVLDAGATESGRPYFVMELVKGVPITEYCDVNQLSTAQRLALFVLVCRAVQHAHQKGIIHRDLKPSNVMVTLHDGEPVPKVIDFGVAKATNQELTTKTVFTEFRQFIGTPEYMSPEQAEMSGLDIDTRADVYALGVLLYELLTGSTPFDRMALRSAGYEEILRIIREEEPQKPSTRLSTLGDDLTVVAQQRGEQGPGLGRLVRGDLDWIVMRALEKDRTRRYETAEQFAADVQRHLSHEPVQASPPGLVYSSLKFYRRNRLGVLSGVAVVLALLAGTGLALWGMLEAGRDRDDAVEAKLDLAQEQAETELARQALQIQVNHAEAALDYLVQLLALTDLHFARDPDLSVRDLLERAASTADGAFADHPSAEARVRTTIGRAFLSLGDAAAAEPHLLRSIELADELAAQGNPIDPYELYDALWSMTHTAFDLGRADSFVFADRALGHAHDMLRDHSPALGDAAAEFYRVLSIPDLEALPLRFADMVALADRSLPHGHPLWRIYANTAASGGLACWHTPYEHLAVEFYGEALRVQRKELPESDPATAGTLAYLVGVLNRLGRFDEAASLIEESIESLLRVLPEDHWGIAFAESQLGQCRAGQGRYDEAEELLVRAFENSAEWKANPDFQVVDIATRVIDFYDTAGRPSEASAYRDWLADVLEEAHYASGWSVSRHAFGPEHGIAPLTELDQQFEYAPTPDAAVVARATREVAALADGALASDELRRVLIGRLIAWWARDAGKIPAETRRELLVLGERLLAPAGERAVGEYTRLLVNLADVELASDRPAEAEGHAQRAFDLLAAAFGPDYWISALARERLAAALEAGGDLERSRVHAEAAAADLARARAGPPDRVMSAFLWQFELKHPAPGSGY